MNYCIMSGKTGFVPFVLISCQYQTEVDPGNAPVFITLDPRVQMNPWVWVIWGSDGPLGSICGPLGLGLDPWVRIFEP